MFASCPGRRLSETLLHAPERTQHERTQVRVLGDELEGLRGRRKEPSVLLGSVTVHHFSDNPARGGQRIQHGNGADRVIVLAGRSESPS